MMLLIPSTLKLPRIDVSILHTFIFLPKILVYCTMHSVSNGNGAESWSGLSDILPIDQFDPNWEEEAQSKQKNVQNRPSDEHPSHETNIEKKLRLRIRNTPEQRNRQKTYTQRFIAKVRQDPKAYQIQKVKKNESNIKWKQNKLSKVTETEKEEYLSRLAKRKKEYKLKEKEKRGGFVSARLQKLSTIRKLKAEGKASEEELQYLKKDLEKEKMARRRQRAAKKEAMRSQRI